MRSIFGVVVVLALSVTVPATAQYASNAVSAEVGGALRLQVDASLFRYGKSTTTSTIGGVDTDTVSNMTGVGTGSGLLSALGNLNVGLGYAATDSIVVGTTLQLAYDTVRDPDDSNRDISLLAVGFAPYVEYMGGDGSIKPFVGATVYVRHAALTTPAFGGGDDKQSDTIFGGGLLGGAHFFVGEGCSVDLAAKFTYGFGSGPEELPMEDNSLTVLDFGITLGVSAWVL